MRISGAYASRCAVEPGPRREGPDRLQYGNRRAEGGDGPHRKQDQLRRNGDGTTWLTSSRRTTGWNLDVVRPVRCCSRSRRQGQGYKQGHAHRSALSVGRATPFRAIPTLPGMFVQKHVSWPRPQRLASKLRHAPAETSSASSYPSSRQSVIADAIRREVGEAEEKRFIKSSHC